LSPKPVAIRKHAFLKRHYRRAVNGTPQFHQLDSIGQWAVLRKEVQGDETPSGLTMLKIMDSREARRDEVLRALEQAAEQRAHAAE